MLDQYTYIVFGVEHYNPLGVVRSLGENGIKPIAIVQKNSIQLTSKSKFIKKLYMVNSIEDGYGVLIRQYGEIYKTGYKPFLFTCDDFTETFLDAHYEELKDKFYFFNAGAAGRIAYYMNKDNINKIAVKHGLDVLDNYVVDKGEIPEKIEYPVITKAIASTVGAWKGDVHICHNEEELKEAYKVIESPKLLLQKYIEKKNEFCLEGFSVNHGNDMFITIASEYNYVMKDQYSPYMTCKNFDRPDVLEKLKSVMKEIGYEGIYEIEFLVDKNDDLHFLEINFRNSTWSYASTRAGMPLPILWSKYMLEGKIGDCYKRLKNNFTAMVELNDFAYRVKKQKMSIFKWIKDFIHSDCKYYLGKNDMGPIFAMVLRKVKR